MDFSDNMEYSYVILCNGDFPARKEVLQILMEADTLVCCDGAADRLLKYRVPDVVIGDLDSISEKSRNILHDRIIKESEQETNDLAKAFRYVCRRIENDRKRFLGNDCISIKILGAAGKREDHTIGNISHLADFNMAVENMDLDIKLSMTTDYGVFIPMSDGITIDIPENREISIFAFDPTLKITSEGLKYPTDNVVFDMWWKATLNCVEKSPIILRFSHKAKALLYIPYV